MAMMGLSPEQVQGMLGSSGDMASSYEASQPPMPPTQQEQDPVMEQLASVINPILQFIQANPTAGNEGVMAAKALNDYIAALTTKTPAIPQQPMTT